MEIKKIKSLSLREFIEDYVNSNEQEALETIEEALQELGEHSITDINDVNPKELFRSIRSIRMRKLLLKKEEFPKISIEEEKSHIQDFIFKN
jgi:hypothetical protein